MRIAVLGGGFQGCCTAIALSSRGVKVTLFDCNPALMTRAAIASEGKVHLGYVYGGDSTLATARMMIRGALSFAPLMQKFLDLDVLPWVSRPFIYLVHRDSQVSVDRFADHLAATHSHLTGSYCDRRYFGLTLEGPPRRLSQVELEAHFNPNLILAAFETSEVAVNMTTLAEKMRQRIAADSAIELRTRRRVTAVNDDAGRLQVHSDGPEGVERERFDSVVNALWDGRLAIDAARGMKPLRTWLHRFKYGIRFQLRGVGTIPSVTIVLGPFGDLVDYRDGSFFVSWYPTCLAYMSAKLSPPAWPNVPDDIHRSQIVAQSFHAMGEIVPPLRGAIGRLAEVEVRGGIITAWGSTDIDDRASELHKRHDIGVNSYGSYHSVDTGKLTMAPHFAEVCADRVIRSSD
jgi:glycine/D-amino acid oxidase-like deaminating enzyme